MPTSTFTPGDEKQDEKLNPGQQDYDRRFNDIAKAEERGTFDDIANNFDKTADSGQEDANINKLRNQEGEGNPWQNNTSPTEAQPKKVRAWFKKKGPLFGIGGGLGVAGIVASGFFAGAALPISLMQNLTGVNDSSSTSMSRRGPKVLQNMMTGNPVECGGVKIKCKMGRISNSAIKKLEKKGLTAFYKDEGSNPVKNKGKRIGYASRNPDGYTIDMDGKKINVEAKNLKGFLADNPKIAAKVLGTKGAFNLRLSAWSSKYLQKKFLNKFNLKKNGGIADGKNKTADRATFLEKTRAKLTERIPTAESKNVGKAAEGITKKAENHLGKAKKGGVAYTLAVAGCVGVKAPSYIAAGVAAIQLAQILPVINDVVLSPGSKLKASGVETGNAATQEDAEAVGTLLTEKTPRKSDGKMTSALDSPYLQSAIGVNKNKLPVSKDFAPGYAFLTSGLVTASREADKKSKAACNAIMSPATMYSAMAVDSAVTIAASATIIGGVVKIIASLAITEIAVKVTKDLVGDQAKKYLVDMAKNDKIPTAQGQELGDVLGISGAAYFSSGGMARGLPTLKTSQLSDYVAIQKQDEENQRQMDVASLSPFDTSSKYTFMGSIVNNFATTAIKTGAYNNGALRVLGTITKMPLSLISKNVHADEDAMKNYCGYASDFDLELENAAMTPAINMAGLPCTGITSGQDTMSTDTAIMFMASEGWLNEDIDIADDATIDDLVSTGYIKKDTPLADFIETCTNSDTGDYLFNAASCTIDSKTKSTENVTKEYGSTCISVEEGGSIKEVCADDSDDFGGNAAGGEGVTSDRALEAMSVFLLDFQITQAINGEDDESASGSGTSDDSTPIAIGTPKDVEAKGSGWVLKDNTDYSAVPCSKGTESSGTYTHPIRKFKFRKCKVAGVEVNSLVSQNVVALLAAAKKDGTPLTMSNSFRSYERQQELYAQNCPNGVCGTPTAKPGNSQHEAGLAIDFNACKKRDTACYKWLNVHAKDYGYYNLPSEAWHWSMSGW